MKTNEFIEEVEGLGFDIIRIPKTGVNVRTNDGKIVLRAGGKNVYKIDCFHDSYDNLDSCTREKLFKLAVEYASTPLKEREEEKKYYIKLKGIDGGIKYINLDKYPCRITVDTKTETNEIQTKFTKHDIEELCLQKFADSDLFELVEVSNENTGIY